MQKQEPKKQNKTKNNTNYKRHHAQTKFVLKETKNIACKAV